MINKPLQILQYNMSQSKDSVMADFLRNPQVLELEVIAIQDPWRNPWQDTTHYPAKATHHLVHPLEGEIGAQGRE